MRHTNPVLTVLFTGIALISTSTALADEPTVHTGDRLGAQHFGPVVVEGMDAVLAREAARLASDEADKGARKPGEWMVPPLGATFQAASGERYVINRWGDLRMAIGFSKPVDLVGLNVVGQSGAALWPRGLRAFGYRAGELIGASQPLGAFQAGPTWWGIGLTGVDRVVFEALPSAQGAAWYGIDDLTFAVTDANGAIEQVVFDFEDIEPRTSLTETKYRGLDWETGGGVFAEPDAVPPPRVPEGFKAPVQEAGATLPVPLGTATAPTLQNSFRGAVRGDANSFSFPPDTHGAIGPNHFVVAVNRIFSVYDRDSGGSVLTTGLGAFLPGSSGDPRVLFDQYSERWIVLVSNFNNRIFIAVSKTSDPLGDWFKSSILVSTDGDEGCFPDYQTIGVDEDGIYTATYMASFCGMAVVAIEKAPLLLSNPDFGAVTVFRNLPFEGAIQPAHHFGDNTVTYLMSVSGNSSMRVRTIHPPITNPTLVEAGFVTVPSMGSPPDAPALGSSVPLDTVGNRLMMAVYRDNRLWAAHTVSVGGRAAVRWYEIAANSLILQQYGTVSDPVRHYFFPSLMVNASGDAVMGFTGSSPSEFASCYAVGRSHADPAGLMSDPMLIRGGIAAQNNIDGFGRNRWGDYSFTSLDPVDEAAIWTIQEYSHAEDIWGTWIAHLDFGDCNANSIDDALDITGGTSNDCDSNNRPDECQLFQNDCNVDLVPDNCNAANLIATHPQDDNVCPTENVQFSAAPMPAGLPVQWQLNGQPLSDDGRITGSTTTLLSITNVSAADAGLYTLAVSEGCLNAVSDPAELLVRELPSIVSEPPAERNVCMDTDLTLAVDAAGSDPLSYQWQKNGADLVGEEGTSLFISDAELSDAGTYQCIVTNSCGQTMSSPSQLAVLAPEITQQPQSQCTELGGSVNFSVLATGPEPLLYSWRKDGVTIPGANSDTLSLTNVQAGDLGVYTVRTILAQSFCVLASDPASLTFSVDTDNDGVLDCQDACPGFDDSLDCDADALPDGCEVYGDANNDGVVNNADLAELVNCYTGAGSAASSACGCTFDADQDNDIDLADFAAWQQVAPTAP